MEKDFDFTPLVADCVMNMLNGYNTGITQEQFYSQNIIDVSDVTEEMGRAVNAELIQYTKENGCYAALPPFEEGSFIDTTERRYIHWKVLEVQEDYYRMVLDHYPIIFADNDTSGNITSKDLSTLDRKCWYLAGRMTVRVKVLTDDEHREMISHHPDFVRYSLTMCNGDTKKQGDLLTRLASRLKSPYHIGGVIEDYIYYIPHDYMKIRKKGKYYTADGTMVNGAWVKEAIDTTLKTVSYYGLESMLFVSTGPMIEMLAYINYMLSQKSTTGSSTLRHFTSIYVPNSDAPELRKERHFGTIKILSEKKPKAITAQNIQRIYTTAVWQRRSHVRHLASGKVVPVKSAVCKRHNLDDGATPQVIYKA